MILCKDCEKFILTGDGIMGICSLPYSWQTTSPDTPCPYLLTKKYTCIDCTHFANDFACMSQEAEDEPCEYGFDPIDKEKIIRALFRLHQHGMDINKIINKVLDELKESDTFKFVEKHKNDITFIPPTSADTSIDTRTSTSIDTHTHTQADTNIPIISVENKKQ